MSVGRSILAIFNDTDTDSNGKSSERLSADLCDKYGLSVRFLVVTEKDFMVQDSTSVTLISSWNPQSRTLIPKKPRPADKILRNEDCQL